MGKLAAPHPRKGLSFINSNALSQIENLASEAKISRFSILENLDSNLWGKTFIANSLKLKGKIVVLAAINKVTNKINRRDTQIDKENFKNIKEERNILINPFLEKVKYREKITEILKM